MDYPKDLLYICVMSLASIVVIFLLTKLMGKRQMSELSMFDYINGITIGSIAAEMSTALEDDYLKPLIAMVIYALASVAISYTSCKSIKIRKFLSGEPLILMENGKIYRKNMKLSKLDMGEFLTQLRNQGYFNISDVHTVILETNGKVSIIPVSNQRPVTPKDLTISVPQDKIVANIIVDGIVIDDNLKYTGNDEQWLQKQLNSRGISKIEDVFLATCDDDNNLSAYLKIDDKHMKRVFE